MACGEQQRSSMLSFLRPHDFICMDCIASTSNPTIWQDIQPKFQHKELIDWVHSFRATPVSIRILGVGIDPNEPSLLAIRYSLFSSDISSPAKSNAISSPESDKQAIDITFITQIRPRRIIMPISTTKSRPTPNLFILPAEIRLRIYQFTLYPYFSQLGLQTAARHSLDHPLLHTSKLIRSESFSVYFRALLLHIRHACRTYREICEEYYEQIRQIQRFPRGMVAAPGSGNSNSTGQGSLGLKQLIIRLGLLAYKSEMCWHTLRLEEQRIMVQLRKWEAWMAGG